MPLGHRTRTQTMSSADFRPLSPSSCRSTSRKQFFLKKICKLLKRIKILELKKQAFSDPLLQYNRFLLSLSERIIVTRMISTRTSTEQTLYMIRSPPLSPVLAWVKSTVSRSVTKSDSNMNWNMMRFFSPSLSSVPVHESEPHVNAQCGISSLIETLDVVIW
jgi:hypothetical protein